MSELEWATELRDRLRRYLDAETALVRAEDEDEQAALAYVTASAAIGDLLNPLQQAVRKKWAEARADEEDAK